MNCALVSELEKRADAEQTGRLVCFVCTGNTCRSPMAEAVFNHLACGGEKALRATSAGLAAFGEPISENALLALSESGISNTEQNNYKGHISRPIDGELMEKAELVVGISSSHAMRLMALFPQFASKITCMPEDIGDPYGGSLDVYRKCLGEIRRGVEKIYSML